MRKRVRVWSSRWITPDGDWDWRWMSSATRSESDSDVVRVRGEMRVVRRMRAVRRGEIDIVQGFGFSVDLEGDWGVEVR